MRQRPARRTSNDSMFCLTTSIRRGRAIEKVEILHFGVDSGSDVEVQQYPRMAGIDNVVRAFGNPSMPSPASATIAAVFASLHHASEANHSLIVQSTLMRADPPALSASRVGDARQSAYRGHPTH